jgi:hypothetical protein
MSLQLRYLQTLAEIAVEQNSTVVFPFPLELLQAFLAATGSTARPASVTRTSK